MKKTKPKPKPPAPKPEAFRFQNKDGIAIEIPSGTTIKQLTEAGLFIELSPPKRRAKR